jgi:hypothetical protein
MGKTTSHPSDERKCDGTMLVIVHQVHFKLIGFAMEQYFSSQHRLNLSSWLISYKTVFFSHNKSASADLSAIETISRTAHIILPYVHIA